MSLEIISNGIEPMLRDLAAAAGHGTETRRALYVVAAKVIDTAISYTPMSTQADLIARVDRDVNLDFARYDVLGSDGVLTTNQGTRGTLPAGTQWMREVSTDFRTRKGVKGKGGETVNYIVRGGDQRHWSNVRWARYQATAAQRQGDLDQSLRIRERMAKESIGLTRQSWVQVADALHLELHAPRLGKIRAAVASNGRQYANGFGYPEESDAGFELVLENSLPSLVRGDGAGILQRAINTRLDAFEIEVKKGVLADLQTFAARYPGLDIRLN